MDGSIAPMVPFLYPQLIQSVDINHEIEFCQAVSVHNLSGANNNLMVCNKYYKPITFCEIVVKTREIIVSPKR